MVMEYLISKLALETTLSLAETEKRGLLEIMLLKSCEIYKYHQEITEMLFNIIALWL